VNTYHVIAIQPVYWRVGRIYRNTSSSTVSCWTVFTELLPGDALIKSVTILCNVVIKVEAYKTRKGFIQGHIWVYFRQHPRCLWCGGWTSPSWVPRETEFRQLPNLVQFVPARRGIATASRLQSLHSCKTGITAQKEPVGDNTGVSRENILLKIHNTWSIIRRAIHSSDQQYRQQPSQQKQQRVSGKTTHQDPRSVSAG
jgi:hypothetical protein